MGFAYGNRKFEFIARSPVDLHVYDPFGRHVGINYTTGELEIQIPNATISITDGQHISVPNPIDGDYNVEVIGTGNGTYTLDIYRLTEEHLTYEDEHDIAITEDEIHYYTISQPFTWIGEVVRSPPGGPSTDAMSNTFTLDEAYNYTLYVENKGLSGLKIKITSTTGYEYEYKHSFKGDKEFFGVIDSGNLGPGVYTIRLIPYGKKGASADFVFNFGG